MLYGRLNEDLRTARLTGDRVKASLLSVVVGDIQTRGGTVNQDGSKEYSTDNCLAVIRSHIKTTEENLKLDGVDEDVRVLWVKDLDILNGYLPKQMTETEIRHAMTLSGLKNMGQLMKWMKETHPNLYDGKLASKVAKDLSLEILGKDLSNEQ